jgi:hypothetical protein
VEAHALTRLARRRQWLLVTAGMIGSAAVPALSRIGGYFPAVMILASFSVFLLPLAYVGFTSAIERAVTKIEPGTPLVPGTRLLGILVFVPLVGAIFEIVLLHRMAKLTATVGPSGGHERAVLWLAIARPVVTVASFPLIVAVTDLLVGHFTMEILWLLHPLASLVLLGLATQLIVQPLLDAAPDTDVTLGAVGASTPTGFASTTADRDDS